MALLSRLWEGVRLFPGAERVLAAHAPPQSDQFCGPFAARAALHAVLDSPPSMERLAFACGTRVWPYDVHEWRPVGAPMITDGWDAVTQADDPTTSGTDAEGVVRGLGEVCGSSVMVEQVIGPDWSGLGSVLQDIASSPGPVGVIANVRTGPIAPPTAPWDVGHFVVLVGIGANGGVAIADSYVELGEDGAPPGCRLVSVPNLAEALGAPPGRSLILIRPASYA